MKLTDKQLKSLEIREKPYKVSDGDGLSVLVKPNASKYFIYRFYFNKTKKELHLGKYPNLSLKQARVERNRHKALVISGINPIESRKREKLEAEALNSTIFQDVANEWLNLKKPSWTDGYYEDIESRLTRLVYPKIGTISLHNLDSAYLYNLLVTIQTQHSIPLGHNCKSYISQIFSFAISLNKATRNPVSDLTGLLQPKKIKHYPAITDPAELGKYLSKAQLFKGSYIVAAALHLTPLIFCRPGELRQLEWSFVNWDEARLEIPSQLMKMKVDHIVPLSTQALSILLELKNSHGNNSRIKHIFPSPYKSQNPISENTVSKALRSIGYNKETITPHGFRATARTLLDEVLEYPIEIIEQQLAHTVKDVHGRAYNRTKHLKQRFRMMQAWADYLDSLISS